ncbi:MAG: hypothetical protein AAFU73_23170 [Planctomycetota bacterium]
MGSALLIGVTPEAFAAPQVDVNWFAEFDDDPGTLHQPQFVMPTEDGGCLVLDGRTDGLGVAPDALAVLRLDGNGDRLWETQVARTDPIQREEHFDANADGRACLIQDDGGSLRLTALSADGSIAFDQIVPSATGAAFNIRECAVQVTDSGDAVVLSYEPVGATERMVLRWFDTAGALRFESVDAGVPGYLFSRPPALAVTGDEATYIVLQIDPAVSATIEVPRIRRVDAAGSLLWQDSVVPVGLPLVATQFRDFDSNADGTTMLVMESSATNVVVVTDGLGQRVFEAPTLLSAIGGILTDGGDVFLPNGFGSALTKIGPTGDVEWVADYPDDTVNQLESVDAAGNPVMWGNIFSGPLQLDAFTGVDGSTGAITWNWTPFLYSPFPLGRPRMTANDRGEIFLTTVPGVGSARVVKLQPRARISSPLCDAFVPNATGSLGELVALGSTDPSENVLTLRASELPPGATCLFLTSPNTTALGIPIPIFASSGYLCLGDGIGRLVGPGDVRTADEFGIASLQLDTSSIPQGGATVPILTGETWHFQAWHREPPSAALPSNLTGAATVQF